MPIPLPNQPYPEPTPADPNPAPVSPPTPPEGPPPEPVGVPPTTPGDIPPPGEPVEPWRSQKLPEIPLRRTGTAEDIARATVYLVSSGFVTGEVLHVTGGEHL